MLFIYFHENYNRLLTPLNKANFQLGPPPTTISCAFSPMINQSLLAVLIKICKFANDKQEIFILWFDCCAGLSGHIDHYCPSWNALPTICAYIHFLFSVNIRQALMNVSGCNLFCLEDFTDTSALYTLLCQMPFCQTTATGKQCKRKKEKMLLRRFNLNCHTTNTHL